MSVEVRVVREVTDEIVGALNGLLPQLSSHAAPLSGVDVEAMVASDVTTLLIAREGDAVIGTLTLVIFAIPSGKRAWIEDVIVDERARGLGAGEALTKFAIEEARRQNARTIDLTSRASRVAANSLYQKLDFVARETNVYRFFIES